MDDDDGLGDATVAVVAHALLNSLAVITGTLATLIDLPIPEERRKDLLLRAHSQAEHVTGVLQDLVRGLHPNARQLLEGLHDD